MLSWIGYESKRATDYLSAMRSDLSKPGMAAPPAFISQQVYSKSYCFQLGPEYPASRQLEKLGPNVVWQFTAKTNQWVIDKGFGGKLAARSKTSDNLNLVRTCLLQDGAPGSLPPGAGRPDVSGDPREGFVCPRPTWPGLDEKDTQVRVGHIIMAGHYICVYMYIYIY